MLRKKKAEATLGPKVVNSSRDQQQTLAVIAFRLTTYIVHVALIAWSIFKHY
jgi:hypothetical protein